MLDFSKANIDKPAHGGAFGRCFKFCLFAAGPALYRAFIPNHRVTVMQGCPGDLRGRVKAFPIQQNRYTGGSSRTDARDRVRKLCP